MNTERQEWTIMVTPEEKTALQKLLGEMRAKQQSALPDVCANKHFLRNRTLMYIYMEYVRAYHYLYITGREVPHKLLMLHYAAIYAVIAQETGVKGGKFYGPEYDYFLMDFCHIVYNHSKDKKGRYRQVGDVYKRYIGKEGEPKMQEQFDLYRDNFRKCITKPRSRVSYGKAMVPSKLDE